MKKIFIVAGDPSGDIHASKLMEQLKLLYPECTFTGIGGSMMESQGLVSLAPIEKMSVVGFWEVAKNYNYFRNVLNNCINLFETEKFDAFIPVDYPGFNIRLSKEAKNRNIPVIYYIAPQLWAWGKSRAKKLQKSIDLLLTVFPFEVEYFSKFGINAKYIGHPLLDQTTYATDFPDFDKRENLIAFFPGSRVQEIKRHIPLMEQIAFAFQKNNPSFRIGFSVSKTVDRKFFDNIIKRHSNWEFWDNSKELMLKAKAGIVKTGTSNLEAALYGMPFIMLYKTSALSYFLGRQLVNLENLSLPNILSEKKIISEYVQNDIDISTISYELEQLAMNNDKSHAMQNEFNNIKKMLGRPGAVMNAAQAIFYFLKKNEK